MRLECLRRSRSAQRAVRSLVTLSILSLASCDWFTDFKSQPSIRYWESAGNDSVPTRSNPTYSIPTTGHLAPAYAFSYGRSVESRDSMSTLRNPTPMSEESLRNGRMLYQINCSVCHGPAGKAVNAPVTQFGFPPFSLLVGNAATRSDGFIFATIRNGANIMPPYNRIEEMDRWDIVNYVRALQGRAAGFTVDTVPFGTPGQTGATVPGATRMGPTRPVPHFSPDSIRRQGAPRPTAGQGPAPAGPGGGA